MMRLFVALELPEMVRQRLVGLQGGVPGARWVAPETMHVTLRFLGELDEPVAQDVDAELARLTAAPFGFTLEGTDYFGAGKKKPYALILNVQRTEPLQALRDKVDRAAVAAGLAPDDRKYRPHVTLARLKDAPMERVRRWLAEHALFQAGPLPAERFVLYRSHLGSAAAAYEPLVTYPLTGAGNGAVSASG
jgi:2'-5' RNA ligase